MEETTKAQLSGVGWGSAFTLAALIIFAGITKDCVGMDLCRSLGFDSYTKRNGQSVCVNYIIPN